MTTTSPSEPVQDVASGEVQVSPPAWCDVCSAKAGDQHSLSCIYYEGDSKTR